MIFPPINLYTKPHQELYEEIQYLKALKQNAFTKFNKEPSDKLQNKIKELEFLYYTRSGRFP